MLVQCKRDKGTPWFKIVSTDALILEISFIPVDNIIGFLKLATWFRSGRLLHSPDPILKSSTPKLFNLSAPSLLKGVEKNKIPFQRAASSRYTGTDTDAFAYSNGGVPSALISLPLRYMHTTVEMVHKNDVENVIKLIYKSLLEIKNNEDFSYFK